MASESNPIKTLTINGVKYKLKGSVEALKCDDITITPDTDGTADVQTLFTSANTSLINTINGVVATPNATLAAALGSDS